jgi:hypothetical protein
MQDREFISTCIVAGRGIFQLKAFEIASPNKPLWK